ncbi:MAG TPA: hypothetical protein VGN97_21960 [Mesorhizobium sp.]|nr:hypothetical protein [Mesorhizobium sp.]
MSSVPHIAFSPERRVANYLATMETVHAQIAIRLDGLPDQQFWLEFVEVGRLVDEQEATPGREFLMAIYDQEAASRLVPAMFPNLIPSLSPDED